MKTTLLKWDQDGRSGKFFLPDGSWVAFIGDRYCFYTRWSGSEDINTLITFLSLRDLCHYLGHGPSEIQGEVQ